QISTPPQITAQPTNLTVVIGQTATFSAGVNGSAPLGYQWLFNGVPLAGANNPVLTFSNTQPSRAGAYQLQVSNTVGIALSSNATLTVIVPPTVTIAATDPFASEVGPDPGTFTITRNGSNSVALT